MSIKGSARVDHKTKELVKRLKAGDIAVISHSDIDEVTARLLIEKRPKAIINTESSITGLYPTQGSVLLLDAGIIIIDNVDKDIFDKVNEGDILNIRGDDIYINDIKLAHGILLSKSTAEARLNSANKNLKKLLNDFIDNTMDYAKKEKTLILDRLFIPKLNINLKGKHVLVVVRGRDYKADLKAIKSYIDEVHPVIIGVDGGADAVFECGYKPDIIVGDMDSVDDRSLRKTRELIVHAYPDGRAPGMARIEKLGLNAHVFPCIGTSEDAALLLAYEGGADLIVTVGSHSDIIDFLEKGRKGMASTFLTRMKIGYKLVDAKGVNKLYNARIKAYHVVGLIVSALFPIAMVIGFSPSFREISRLLYIHMQMLLGW